MQLSVTVPDGTNIDGVRAALAQFGAVVKAKPAAKARSRVDTDFEPVIVRRKETGEVIREIDGVSVQKAITKLMVEVNKGKNSDGRRKGDYPQLYKGAPLTPEGYMLRFCQSRSHVPADYTNGVRA